MNEKQMDRKDCAFKDAAITQEGRKPESDQTKKSVKDREYSLPDDGHGIWDWRTKYECTAWWFIGVEALYLTILFFVSLFILFRLYTGNLYEWYHSVAQAAKSELIFQKEMYCALFGFLGGTVYCIKILYKALAHGQWHIDRVLWRFFTPWVSLVLSIVIASFMSSKVFGENYYSAILIGFFAGYFSESAIGKLYEIAHLLFD